MRNLTKSDEPEILKQNADIWLDQYLEDKNSSTKKYRYRHKKIKEALKKETGHKCVYCESKIGHNTPGDIEHKIPSSKAVHLHFDWNNMTMACAECNRRKNDYYEDGEAFLDPYIDDVESLLEHHGPIILWRIGQKRAEITVRILELNSFRRSSLICRKMEKIEEVCNLAERLSSEKNRLLKLLLLRQLEQMKDKSSEYSAMVISILKTRGGGCEGTA
ncbi:HNH endonuclease [Desulfobacterales bacterium HSG2]|nr:HNH endonuclease [Desulfobacterales bacterium HSG2]